MNGMAGTTFETAWAGGMGGESAGGKSVPKFGVKDGEEHEINLRTGRD